jgi:D-alanyl-D-alanine carboxypeptidase
MKKILTLTAFALTIAILLCFCTVIITEIVYKVNGEPVPQPSNSAGDIKYTSISLSSGEVNKGDLLIINKSYPLKNKSNSSAVVNVYDYNAASPARYAYRDSKSIKLMPSVIVALNKMIDALKTATGCEDILLAYGYFEPKETTIACDYQHELGTSFDLKIINSEGSYSISDNETVAKWFADNAHKYGFINSDPSGEYEHGSDEKVPSTQFRYVGAHATYIASGKKGGDLPMDLEAYAQLIRTKYAYSGNHLRFLGADGDSYEVYYVASSGESTNVPVPENYEYTVSGDNIGGFIVTVCLSKPVK